VRVFQTHISSVLSAFRRMSQMLHLDVSKVDRVFCTCCNLLQPLEGVRGRVEHRRRAGSGGAQTPREVRSYASHGRPDGS
jgi:hypothetical protein